MQRSVWHDCTLSLACSEKVRTHVFIQLDVQLIIVFSCCIPRGLPCLPTLVLLLDYFNMRFCSQNSTSASCEWYHPVELLPPPRIARIRTPIRMRSHFTVWCPGLKPVVVQEEQRHTRLSNSSKDGWLLLDYQSCRCRLYRSLLI